MKTSLQTISLKYKNGIVLPSVLGKNDNEELALMFQAEVMRLGYVLDQDLFDQISHLDKKSMTQLYKNVVFILRERKGANKKWKPFYPNFPAQVMKASDWELFSNAICHYWSYGSWLPTYKVSKRLPKMEIVQFTALSALTEQECLGIFTDLLGSNVSLSASSLSDLEWFIKNYDDILCDYLPEKIPFKETLCTFVGVCFSNKKEFFPQVMKNATDVLRVMTHLSGGDISLAENTKFKSWKRSERRLFISALENCVRADDIARHGEKWKRAFHGLHIGDYAKKAPKTYAIAQKLRNDKIVTFNSAIEEALILEDIETLVGLLASRPGELARRMDHLMRSLDTPEVDRIIKTFKKSVERVDTRVLIQLLGHMKGRTEAVESRIVLPKGRQAKARVLKKSLPALPRPKVEAVCEIIRNALFVKFQSKEPLGKVWIDPSLKKCPVPMAQRSSSSVLREVSRGTKLPLSEKSTLRLFVWWIGKDVDLSCVLYDENLKKKDHISYTNLRIPKINSCHSGDVTYAPKGAAEFIDIDMEQAIKAGVRYVMMNVLDFTGQKFSEYKECFAGWMTRDHPNHNALFDPKTVEQKIDLRTPTQMAAPVIFDLITREAIWLDLTGRVSRRLPNNVESNAATIEDLAVGAMKLSEKFNLYDLFEIHASARGEQVNKKSDAEAIFSMEEGITPFDLAKIGAEYIS